MLDSKKKKKEKKGMKIARSIKRKKISARERERDVWYETGRLVSI